MSESEKEIRGGDQKFPDDIAPKELPIAPIKAPSLQPHRLDAYQLSGYDSPSHCFGMDPLRTAAVLRDTADRIERKEYLIQECNILTRAQQDDYQMTFLTLVFHQKKTEA